jgi:murein L,D-transpeptidase YcbB/YkuD
MRCKTGAEPRPAQPGRRAWLLTLPRWAGVQTALALALQALTVPALRAQGLTLPATPAGQGGEPAEPWRAFIVDARPAPSAAQALALLADAAAHGLRPADYGAAALQTAWADGEASRWAAAQAEAFARRLHAALLRLLQHLHTGRVDPRRVHARFEPPQRTPTDIPALLQQALADADPGALAALAQRLLPPLPLYAQLQQALAQYRAMAAQAAWAQPLPPLPVVAGPAGRAPKLEPGQPWAGLPLLADRLLALGDLPLLPEAPRLLEGDLVSALQAFQSRHGLAADGVLGRATLAALQVRPEARARQIELALERLRWTPLLRGSRMVVINVPEYVLRAYEVGADGRITVREQMRVIVGRARATRTPLFGEDMRFIEFSPYWNVPISIARGELIPRLRRDPGHFAREGFEFVGPGGQVQASFSAARLDEVLAGGWRIRQRPGPRNALGDIKFVLPNDDAIFLHHTPSVGLFARERRDFSHGCIRVEDPVALARFVLAPQPDWTEARIRQAMSAGTSTTLRMAQPVPVLIAYGTALVLGGRLHFFDDVYGYDRLLDAALNAA